MKSHFSIAASLLTACVASEPSHLELQQQALTRSEQTWRSADLTTYQFLYRTLCFGCDTEAVVQVDNAQVTSAIGPDGVALPQPAIDRLPAVEDLFDVVQSAIDREVARLDVSYNTELGYPEDIFINESAGTVDDEVSILASDLRAVEGEEPKGPVVDAGAGAILDGVEGTSGSGVLDAGAGDAGDSQAVAPPGAGKLRPLNLRGF